MSDAPRPLAMRWLIAGMLIALIAACAAGDEPTPSGSNAGIVIDEGWRAARRVTGHHVHVLQQKLACRSCHELSPNELGKVNVRSCAACHEREAKLEHAAKQAAERFGGGVSSDCTSCHEFAVKGPAREAALREPEPSQNAAGGGGGGRAQVAALASFAPGDCKRCHGAAQGAVPAVVVHGAQECGACHQPHEHQTPVSAPCSDCHAEVRATHAGSGKSTTEACRTCHQHQHGPASEARSTCAECHATQEPIVAASAALFEPGHESCLGCHTPHSFEKSRASECRSCHQQLRVLGAGRVLAHAACTSCHSPHDVKRTAAKACQGCHESIHSDHPTRGAAGTCVSCHEPHPSAAHATAIDKPCSSCHQFAASDHASHGGVDCVKCHEPHQFLQKLGDRKLCQGCHEAELRLSGKNPGHATCEGCHSGLPHQPAAAARDCQSCHQRQHAEITAGHAECKNCHEPHSGSAAKPCGSCHSQQQHSAPEGHQACAQCHQPHSGSPAGASCSSCHQAETKTPHGGLASGCLTCHSPHDRAPTARAATCTGCHQPTELPGLHAQTKHRSCQQCHGGHGDPKGALREVCLSCHQDRKTHFPDAPRCANCHLFTPNH